jgi:hypothetical protein
MELSGTKVCNICHIEKTVDDFYFLKKKSGARYPSYICKPCDNARSTQWAKINKDKVTEISKRFRERHPGYFRKYDLVKNNGMTQEEYVNLWAKQDGKCAICDRPDEKIGKRGYNTTLVVDHDHQTGQIRGILCRKCNSGLGMFEDSVESLRAAVQYLQPSELE